MSTDIKTITLQIKGMHCVSCAMNIDFELEDVPGVEEVRTDYIKQICTVRFDPKQVSQKDLQTTIADLGYSSHE